MNPPTHPPGPLMQVAITSPNVPALAGFYRDQVGLKHLFDAGPTLSFFDLGGVRLMISAPSSPNREHGQAILYYRVTDLDQVHAGLKTRGVCEERPPQLISRMPDHDLWASFFRDPDQNIFSLMCEKRPPAPPQPLKTTSAPATSG